MPHHLVSSGSPYEPQIGFSRAVRTGPVISVSGTGPIPKPGEPLDYSSAYEQTRLCLRIMCDAVRAAGGTPEQIHRTRIFLTEATDWQEAARAHAEVFGQTRPACTFVVIKSLLDPRWKVETEADAWVG